jgi:WGR domain
MNTSYNLNLWQEKNWQRETRYYKAAITQDLFGNWIILRAWGRVKSRLGRTLALPVASYEDALTQLEQIHKKRLGRGYAAHTRKIP